MQKKSVKKRDKEDLDSFRLDCGGAVALHDKFLYQMIHIISNSLRPQIVPLKKRWISVKKHVHRYDGETYRLLY